MPFRLKAAIKSSDKRTADITHDMSLILYDLLLTSLDNSLLFDHFHRHKLIVPFGSSKKHFAKPSFSQKALYLEVQQ